MYRFKLSLQFLQLSSSKYLRSRPFSTSFENVGSMACHLKSRSVIRFRGPDTVKFLQGLVTNDVQKLGDAAVAEAPNSYPLPTPNLSMTVVPPIYAAFLTPQGRFLYDMFLYRPPRPDEKLDDTGSGPGPSPEEFELFADVDKSSSDELLQTLNKYRLRSKVDIENVADDFSCWQQFGWNLGTKSTSSTEGGVSASSGWGGGVDTVGISSSLGSKSGWKWNKDPRLDCLGYRGIFPSDAQPPAVAADEETGEENYLRWRFEKGVAEGPEEIPKGEAIPLEYNLAGLNAISFDKGCYVGQELVARTHHVGVIRKRLFPLKLSNDDGKDVENKVAPKAIIIDSGSQKKVGTVNTAVGSQGLGLLRLEEAFKSSGSLIIQGQKDVKVEFFVPEWWPTSWYKDYQPQSAAA